MIFIDLGRFLVVFLSILVDFGSILGRFLVFNSGIFGRSWSIFGRFLGRFLVVFWASTLIRATEENLDGWMDGWME